MSESMCGSMMASVHIDRTEIDVDGSSVGLYRQCSMSIHQASL